MPSVPPGPKYLARALPSLLFPFALVYVATHLNSFLPNAREIDPQHLKWAYILCFPVFYTIVINYYDLKIWLDARRNGAVLPPRSRHDWTPGNVLSVFRFVTQGDTGYLGEGIEEGCEKNGYIFNFRTLFQNRFLVAEPEYLKYILATRFDNHEKGHPVRSALGSLLGVGVFASDGDMWKFHRQLTRPFFARDKISDFDIFERHASEAIDILKSRLREGYAVDFQDLVGRFTLDSATEFLFARSLKTLSSPLPYPHTSPLSSVTAFTDADTFIKSFNDVQMATSRRTRMADAWPLFEFWQDRVNKDMGVIHGYMSPIIKEAFERKQLNADEDKGVQVEEGVQEDETLIDYLVKRTEDPIIIRDEVLNILIAGRDTTAATLTLIIYLLAQHPHVFQRLREEIISRLGTSRKPTFDDFREMKYLRAVINETLRLYPVVPFNLKTSISAQLWPNMQDSNAPPYYIPAQCRIPQAFVVLHRRKDLWGEDALEYDPDRFLDERVQRLVKNPYIFLPFNAGPRICLGQQFAYHEASYFLVRLLQQFSSVELALDAQPPETLAPEEWKSSPLGRKAREKVKMGSHLTLYMRGGLWVRFTEAKEDEAA